MIRTRIKVTTKVVEGKTVTSYQAQVWEFPDYLSYHPLMWKLAGWIESDIALVVRLQAQFGATRGTLEFSQKVIDLYLQNIEDKKTEEQKAKAVKKSIKTKYITYP